MYIKSITHDLGCTKNFVSNIEYGRELLINGLNLIVHFKAELQLVYEEIFVEIE